MSADWIDILRAACVQRSQRAVAEMLGYSQSVISQVIKGTYPGDTAKVQAAVEGALMRAEVDCPVIGTIPRQRCIEHQRRPFAATNPMRVKLYRECRSGCPHSFLPQTIFPRDASVAQPAVASNTGSPGAASPTLPHRVTEPTRRRKRPLSLKGAPLEDNA